MIRIIYPNLPFRLKQNDNKKFIFDVVRKKWLELTPEEWVRQNFLQYLIYTKQYPTSLLAVEKKIRLGALTKRCDIVVYQDSKAWMIVECKAAKENLNNATVEQVLLYQQSLQVAYLIITNGSITYGFDVAKQKALNNLPNFG